MKNLKKVFIFILTIGVFLSVVFFVGKNKKMDEENDLINISKLSNSFMEKYFEEVQSISNEDKENMLIVTSKDGVDDSYGATKVIEAPNNQYFLQYDSNEEKEAALVNLSKDEKILSAQENVVYYVEETTYNSWGVESMGLDSAITNLNSDELNEVTVAIIDTGLDIELANKYYEGRIAETYNVLEESTTVMTDENGHGTHIFGTIAESTPSNVKILPIKVTEGREMYDTDIKAAIEYVTYYEKADVINMSFGGYQYSQMLDLAIEAARQKNIISVAAAGNENSYANHYPSALDNTISIASVDSNLNKSTFSNYGSQIDFTAPGTNIKSIMSSEAAISKNRGNTDGDNDHETISGTSMATPHAVSAVAILKSIKKDLTLENTIELLQSRTIDLGDPGWDKYYGHGLISFKNVEFCDGTDCDEHNVFKESSKIVPTSIEIKYVLRTTKNYGTINNFTPSQVIIYDSTGNYTSTTLGELNDVEIVGYDAYEIDEQVIKVKWKGLETTFNFTNPTDWNSGWTYEIIENNDIIITGFEDFAIGGTRATKLYVPEKINGYNVVAIGNESSNTGIFRDAIKTSYKEIILPSSLIEIKGKYTFSSFDYVEKITALSDSLKINGDYVFADNKSLVEVVGTIESLGKNTFYNNVLLQKVTLSDDITELPDGSFFQCSNLESINMPSKLVSIGDSVFNNSLKLNNIILPEGLKTIGDYAFSYTSIENITLPDSLESIGERSFANSNIKNLSISENLTSIGKYAFLGCSSLESIVVDEDNPIYDSRENSNALIETETNTLLKGIASTKIPNTVTSIGDQAYSYDLRIEEVEIPDSVIKIGNYSFYECNYLTSIKIPKSVQSIGDYALSIYPVQRQDMEVIPLTVFTYSDAFAREYAVLNEINYETLDYTDVFVQVSKREYNAFEKVNNMEDILNVMLQYNVGKTINSSYSESRTFKYIDEYEIKYINDNDSFRFGDTYYVVSGNDVYGVPFEKQVGVTILKAIPKYNVPTNLKAELGQNLFEVTLPDGFEWMTSDVALEEEGTLVFKAKYTPEDIQNYEIVENIDVQVLVESSKKIVVPNISISDKTYDGTTEIDVNNIEISNLEEDNYNIESIILTGIDVGEYTTTIKIKLTDEAFKNYCFEKGKQEAEFSVNYKIIPYKLEKPSLKVVDYVYNGLEQVAVLNNYYEDKMNITGNKRTNVGEQDIIISLKNNNYIWNDNSTDNVVLKFKIDKADSNIKYTASDNNIIYDGNRHGINLNITSPSNAKVLYADDSGKYILDEMPSYKEIGKYVIKYMLYIDDNYEPLYGENILTIFDPLSYNLSTDYEGIYDGKEHTFNLNINLDEYTIKYSVGNTNYDLDEIPKFIEVGEYTVNYKIIYNSNVEIIGTNKVKIYGIKNIDESIVVEDNILLVTDQKNDISEITERIKIYSNTSTITYYDKNNKVVDSGTVGTGSKVVINVNGTDFEYQISILGDVTGEGIVNIADIIKIADDILGLNTLVNESEKKAAEVTGDKIINIADVIKIADYTLDNSMKLWR